jgi:hypothetical protein
MSVQGVPLDHLPKHSVVLHSKALAEALLIRVEEDRITTEEELIEAEADLRDAVRRAPTRRPSSFEVYLFLGLGLASTFVGSQLLQVRGFHPLMLLAEVCSAVFAIWAMTSGARRKSVQRRFDRVSPYDFDPVTMAYAWRQRLDAWRQELDAAQSRCDAIRQRCDSIINQLSELVATLRHIASDLARIAEQATARQWVSDFEESSSPTSLLARTLVTAQGPPFRGWKSVNSIEEAYAA